MFLAITWNRNADWGHTSKLLASKDHPAGKGADVILKVKTAGYRPGLYSKKKEILAHCVKED